MTRPILATGWTPNQNVKVATKPQLVALLNRLALYPDGEDKTSAMAALDNAIELIQTLVNNHNHENELAEAREDTQERAELWDMGHGR